MATRYLIGLDTDEIAGTAEILEASAELQSGPGHVRPPLLRRTLPKTSHNSDEYTR